MIADPLDLQIAAGDAQYRVISNEGLKTTRLRVTPANGEIQRATCTISHDVNKKSGRIRSVLRFDASILADSNQPMEDVAAYLVIDRKMVSAQDPSQAYTKEVVAQILSFFATDPTAATPSSIPLAISTANGVEFLRGEP